jgi:hypothetical protein
MMLSMYFATKLAIARRVLLDIFHKMLEFLSPGYLQKRDKTPW